jgi:hypothetical protein
VAVLGSSDRDDPVIPRYGRMNEMEIQRCFYEDKSGQRSSSSSSDDKASKVGLFADDISNLRMMWAVLKMCMDYIIHNGGCCQCWLGRPEL